MTRTKWNKDSWYMKNIGSARWRILRRAVLEQHPTCQRCEAEGRLSAACEVHHINPVERAITPGEQEARMFNPDNLVALCHACHVQTHKELGFGGSKKEVKERNEQQAKEINRRFFGEE